MNIKKITELRNATGLGIAQCSKLLKDSDGDFEKAILLAVGLTNKKIEKMKERVSGVGKIFSYIHTGSKKGAMIHISCETDFVANTEDFVKLGNELALHIVAAEPTTVEEFIEQPFVKDGFVKVKELINNLQIKVGEKIEIKNFYFMSS